MPIAEGCEVNKIWNLNRIENFSGLTDGLDSFESKKLNKFIINFFMPIVLINSQILVDIKCIDQKDAMIYNNLRNWKGQEQNLITGSFSQNIDLFGNSATHILFVFNTLSYIGFNDLNNMKDDSINNPP